MAGVTRVVEEKAPRALADVVYRARVMVDERYTVMRHILSYEDDVNVVRKALELAVVKGDERKIRLLNRKLRSSKVKG